MGRKGAERGWQPVGEWEGLLLSGAESGSRPGGEWEVVKGGWVGVEVVEESLLQLVAVAVVGL